MQKESFSLNCRKRGEWNSVILHSGEETLKHLALKTITGHILKEKKRQFSTEVAFNKTSVIVDILDITCQIAYEFESRNNKEKIEAKTILLKQESYIKDYFYIFTEDYPNDLEGIYKKLKEVII